MGKVQDTALDRRRARTLCAHFFEGAFVDTSMANRRRETHPRRAETLIPRVFGIPFLWKSAPCGKIPWRERISLRRCEKGNPAARRARKATGLEGRCVVVIEAAGLPNSGGVSEKKTPLETGGRRTNALRTHTGTVAEARAVCAVGSRRLSGSAPPTKLRRGACRGGSAAREAHPSLPERFRIDGLGPRPSTGTTSGAAAGA